MAQQTAADGIETRINDTLSTLNLQIRDGLRELQSAIEETSRLHEENAKLVSRAENADLRVSDLESECANLSQEVQRLRLEAWRTDSATVSQTNGQRAVSQKRKPPGGFSVLPHWHHDYSDIWKPTDKESDSPLRDAAVTWKLSNRKPLLLREQAWKLTEITPAKAEYAEEDVGESAAMETDDSSAEDDVHQLQQNSTRDDIGQLQPSLSKADAATGDQLVQIDPNSERPGTQGHLSPAHQKEKQTHSVEQSSHKHGHARKKSTSNPYDPRREPPRGPGIDSDTRGVKRSLPRNLSYEEGYRRKSVCVYCWETRGFCDSWSQCGTCRVNGARCIRKLCGSGLSCRNPRCPCLHPGEWDETNPEFIVEEGPLPDRRKQSERYERFELERSLGDFYRPGESRRDR